MNERGQYTESDGREGGSRILYFSLPHLAPERAFFVRDCPTLNGQPVVKEGPFVFLCSSECKRVVDV